MPFDRGLCHSCAIGLVLQMRQRLPFSQVFQGSLSEESSQKGQLAARLYARKAWVVGFIRQGQDVEAWQQVAAVYLAPRTQSRLPQKADILLKALFGRVGAVQELLGLIGSAVGSSCRHDGIDSYMHVAAYRRSGNSTGHCQKLASNLRAKNLVGLHQGVHPRCGRTCCEPPARRLHADLSKICETQKVSRHEQNPFEAPWPGH